MGVEFNENKPVNYGAPTKNGGLTNLCIKLGLAKDKKGADKVMIVVIIICVALTIYIGF
jgi:hypothetical protein